MLCAVSLSLVSMRIQKSAYDLADKMATDKDSGISNRNLEGFVKRIVPNWSRGLAWMGGLASVTLLVYVGIRYGWPWALGYIVIDHLIKNINLPFWPGRTATDKILLKQAQKSAPDKVPNMERALRD